MSKKNVDKYNRYRSVTVGFRVSPEEQETLNRVVALSGLTKQEYCYRKCMDRVVMVEASPRLYQALKLELETVYRELLRIASGEAVCDELLVVLEQINVTLYGLKGGDVL